MEKKSESVKPTQPHHIKDSSNHGEDQLAALMAILRGGEKAKVSKEIDIILQECTGTKIPK